MIDLKPEKEPLIHAAIKRDALLENIVVDKDGKCLYEDNSRTENTRGSSTLHDTLSIPIPYPNTEHLKPEACIPNSLTPMPLHQVVPDVPHPEPRAVGQGRARVERHLPHVRRLRCLTLSHPLSVRLVESRSL